MKMGTKKVFKPKLNNKEYIFKIKISFFKKYFNYFDKNSKHIKIKCYSLFYFKYI